MHHAFIALLHIEFPSSLAHGTVQFSISTWVNFMVQGLSLVQKSSHTGFLHSHGKQIQLLLIWTHTIDLRLVFIHLCQSVIIAVFVCTQENSFTYTSQIQIRISETIFLWYLQQHGQHVPILLEEVVIGDYMACLRLFYFMKILCSLSTHHEIILLLCHGLYNY